MKTELFSSLKEGLRIRAETKVSVWKEDVLNCSNLLCITDLPKNESRTRALPGGPVYSMDTRLPLTIPLLCLEPASWGLNWAPSPQSSRPQASFSLCPLAPWHVRCWRQQTCHTGQMLSHKGCCCYSVTKSHMTLCNPMGCSTPGFPVLHYLPEFVQTHVHWVSLPSNHLNLCGPPSPFALNLSQLQGLFQWVGSSYQVAKVLELQLQYSILPMNIQDWFPLGLTGLISLQSKGLLRVFSSTTVGKHQFLDTQPSFWFSSHNHTWLLEKTIALIMQTFVGKVVLFNMLSRFVRAFLPRSKHLLIPWLQSPSAVILEPKKIKSLSTWKSALSVGSALLCWWLRLKLLVC